VKAKIKFGALLLAGSMCLAACSSTTAAKPSTSNESGHPDSGTYTIGFLTAKTGPVAFAGIDYVEGAEVALNQINSSGLLGPGVKMALDEQEDSSVPSTAVSLSREFVANNSVLGAFGSILSPDAYAVMPIYKAAKMPYDIYGAISANMADPPYIYRTAPLPQLAQETLAQEAITKYKPSSVMFVVTSNDTGMEASLPYFIKPFTSAGVKNLGTIDTLTTQTSFASEASQILGKNPSMVVVNETQDPEGAMIAALREVGYKGQILADSTLDSPALVSSYGAKIEDAPFAVHFSCTLTTTVAKTFCSEFENRFHAVPSTYAAQGAIAVEFYAAGLADAGKHPTRASLAASLEKVATIPGNIYGPGTTVSGGQLHDPSVSALQFDSHGNVVPWNS